MPSHTGVLVEVCAFDVEWALKAAEAGADRIELCSNFLEGGTTPSYATIRKVRAVAKAALFVMVRPRGGDFLYSKSELDVMREDIRIAKCCGADGVVFGVLDARGNIDIPTTTELVALARPLEVTFHRAFDACVDPIVALDALIELGMDRILTSGQAGKASEGADLIAKLVERSAGRVGIIAGSGVRSSNVRSLIEKTGVREVHLSGHTTRPSLMEFERKGLSAGGLNKEDAIHTVDTAEIGRVKKATDAVLC
ncbi:hypothetical protein BSKO_04423 [Bryopsis sp. KO-2023]|nr:hypothetical protein BSKO_04423 [Bryopsis sp. KO-2023]